NSAHPLKKVGTVGTDPSMRSFQLAGEKGLVLPVPAVATFSRGMRRKEVGRQPLARRARQGQVIAALTSACSPALAAVTRPARTPLHKWIKTFSYGRMST